MTDAWTELSDRTTELKAIEGLMGMAEWDQQVMMPAAGSGARGAHMSLLSGLHHEKLTDDRVGELLETLTGGDLTETQSASVRNLQRDFDRATRVPAALVKRGAVVRAKAFPAWAEAKEASDFSQFSPHLAELIDIAKETVSAIDSESDPYDVLLAPFDPGSTVATLDPMFDRLGSELGTLLDALEDGEAPAKLEGPWDVAKQRSLHDEVATALGFDWKRGRLDNSEHPFTVGVHPTDVRITTHIYPEGLLSGLSGTVHEVGHGLYEQGIPTELSMTAAGSAASFGLHESQSRFWENTIGRSRAFSNWLSSRANKRLGTSFSGEELYGAANRVQRSLVRVFADEVTYNLHILVRYTLERRIFAGEVTVDELPDAWTDLYESTIGVRPGTAAEGVLQDVHWAGGMFAYFPSYTLGNLYAASLGATLVEEMPDLWDQVEAGEFQDILGWLRHNVHSRAHLADAPDIMAAAVGERDHVEDLVDYLWSRHGALHGVTR
ncbi:MAG: carboxypeptidase M32 [Proteobacteria bacterium]|nr:carboxypeptidase M32 [Pseudomonadota bacterium]MCP4922207.1 carboxypeptidase M32 [Pseudomonadota bacterium]